VAPGNLLARNNLASSLFKLGQNAEAIEQWNYVLKILPENIDAHRCIGDALLCSGNVSGAIEHYEAALNIMPDDILVQCRLAWVLATACDDNLRDGVRAVRFAKSVAQAVDYKSTYALDVLAASYAEVRDFKRAAQTAELAIKILAEGEAYGKRTQSLEIDGIPDRGSQDDSNRIAIEKRLELYLQEQPYREQKSLSGSALEHSKASQVPK